MSAFSQLHRISLQVAVSLLLSLLCACSYYDYDAVDNNTDTPTLPTAPTEKYINLSIIVSSGNESTTRAPQGGENGDGREAGSERENEVTGITLILYQDAQGINTTKANTKIEFIKYYPVDLVKRREPGTEFETKRGEAIYTTGKQSLANTNIKTDKPYRAIVVANLDLTTTFGVGTNIKVIRDHIVSTIYDGDGIGINAKNFVMSLEKDCTLDFSTATTERSEDQITYNFDNIRIERLAARVDFWMKGATYSTEYETPGYVYDVEGSNDKFVLTAVTPFNLSDDNEYLIKRITTDDTKTDWTEGELIFYLEDEKVTNTSNPELLNFVLDPHTTSKTGNTVSDYMMKDYALENFLKTDGSSTYERKKLLLSTHILSNAQGESPKSSYTEDNTTADNLIICYPKENTLWKSTPLYYYATGLCIEGYYYKSDGSDSEKLTYYGFLRHQGEKNSEAYKIYTKEELKDKDKVLQGSFPMNFGVVRNNIYRISIDKITEKGEKPEITWQIKVKKWDEFKHDIIYM